jgi:hypothetical protein
MTVEIEALITLRSRELAELMNGLPLSRVKGSRRRQRAQQLRADLLELLAIRRRIAELARSAGPVGAVRHSV